MTLRWARTPLRAEIVTVLEYVLMFFVLFYTSTWSLFTSANCNTSIRLGLPLLCLLIFMRSEKVRYVQWRRLILLAVFLAIYIVATRYNLTRVVLYYFAPMLLLVAYIGLVERQEGSVQLLFKLSDIVTVLTAISLFCFLFGTIFHILPGESTASYSWGGTVRTCHTYYHLFYEAQKINFMGHTFVRNCSIFPEAPGFAIFLVIATASEVLLRQHPRIWRCALYVLATVTTFSAKAVVLVAAVFAMRYILMPSRSEFWRKVKRLLVPVALLGVGAVAAVMLWDKMQTVSGFMRIDDVVACIKTWRTSPIFGTGYWNDESVIPFFSYADRYNNGLSMGMAVVLAQGGLYLLCMYLIPLVNAILRARGIYRRMLAGFGLMYLALLFTSNIAYNFLTLFLIAVFMELGRYGWPEPLVTEEGKDA